MSGAVETLVIFDGKWMYPSDVRRIEGGVKLRRMYRARARRGVETRRRNAEKREEVRRANSLWMWAHE